MEAVGALAPTVGVLAACRALGVARATFYRHGRAPRPRRGPAAGLALAQALRQAALP